MDSKPPLPGNPNGLIRSYLARQHTARVSTPAPYMYTPAPMALQPVAPQVAVPQPGMAPPIVPTPPAGSHPMMIAMPGMTQPPATPYALSQSSAPVQTRTAPFVIKPSGKSTAPPALAYIRTPARPVTTPLPAAPPQPVQAKAPKPQRATTPTVSSASSTAADTAAPLMQEASSGEAPPLTPEQAATDAIQARKRMFTRILLALVALIFVAALAILWHISTTQTNSPTVVTQQQLASSSISTPTTPIDSSGGGIQAYITGAVKHPGVYKLGDGARIYELLQAAGGALPNADLVALNLAAKLNDGQEVYVLTIGETPPASLGSSSGQPAAGSSGAAQSQLVNLNTASVTDMRQTLHVSATTAQKIIDYRQQHGPYTTIDQLLQVVSVSIYNKIKSLVTV